MRKEKQADVSVKQKINIRNCIINRQVYNH